jgi:hypothetical protein
MSDWRTILSSPEDPDAEARQFRVLEKPGYFFLYLPAQARSAERTLELYPAQRRRGRAISSAIKLLLRCRLPLPGPTIDVTISASSRLGKFMQKLVPGRKNALPTFGVLDNYNHNLAQRYVLLLFDEEDRPRVVMKLGLTPEGRAVIRRERDFFLPTPAAMPGLPRLIDYYSGPEADAVALAYEEGHNLYRDDTTRLSAVLGAWVWRDSSCLLSELPKWKEAEALRAREPRLDFFMGRLATTQVRPVLAHGDFVPWNIRVTPAGDWRVLDWERGRRLDLPAWDWFHFVVAYQLGSLRSTPSITASAIEKIWSDPRFTSYAVLTGIQDIVKEYTLVYLLYTHHHHALVDKGLLQTAEEILRRHFPQVRPLAASV